MSVKIRMPCDTLILIKTFENAMSSPKSSSKPSKSGRQVATPSGAADVQAPVRATSSTPSSRRGLGRGLSALIPESDLDLLSGLARGDIAPQPVVPRRAAEPFPRSKQVDSSPEPGINTSLQGGHQTGAARSEDQVSSPESGAEESKTPGTASRMEEIRYLPVGDIEPNPFQPRQVFSEEELEALSASLREHGVLQPVLVRPLGKTGRFQLIAGERRWRAAQRAEIRQIPAIAREVDDRRALELAIIENVQRHDISAVESAHAYRRLIQEFGLSQEQVATRVGKSRAAVANTIRLLDLPDEAQQALRDGKITEGHGRALLMASGEGARRALLRRVLRDELTVRDVERMARLGNSQADGEEEASSSTPNAKLTPLRVTPDVSRLENTLQRALGMRLSIRTRKRGGQVTIEFNSPEELQRLVQRLTQTVDNKDVAPRKS